MRDQIIQITDQSSLLATFRRMSDRREITSSRDGAFWMRIYAPMSDVKTLVSGNRQLCPWAMAAELSDRATSRERRRILLDALENGQKTMRLYELPSNRIMFVEETSTGRVTIWVD